MPSPPPSKHLALTPRFVTNGSLKLGSHRDRHVGLCELFAAVYDETLRDPTTASPLFFPETVFNAPASHIAALLGTTAIN